ncbi:MAG: 50S ribosomal protein L24 [Candidatus Pacebacteria bacterium]|nr:50S ribosomal protein L24 [Candidatus Paceibacterota bacterium]NUQ57177.1 50S ribosomal protein L24 [Candidatus Paceibacter sp.]
MIIKKGDTVKILSGKDRGKTGKVSSALPKYGKILVEGVNIRKKHLRPRKQGQKGQVAQIAFPISASAAMIVCKACGKPARAGQKMIGAKKVRVCKKCGGEM